MMLFINLLLFLSGFTMAMPADIPFVLTDDQVTIISSSQGGNGCPVKDTTTTIASGGTSMTTIYNDFIASFGPNVDMKENRKFCQMTIKLQFPPGLTFGVFGTTQRGSANLPQGLSGLLEHEIYLSGQGASKDESKFSTEITGAYNDDYLKTMEVEADGYIDCAKTKGGNLMLNIKATLNIKPTSGPCKDCAGTLTIDTIDTNYETVLNLQWKKCP